MFNILVSFSVVNIPKYFDFSERELGHRMFHYV